MVNNFIMKKINLFNTFDCFFRILIVFLTIFVWVRYYFSSLFLSLVLTLILTTIFEVFYRLFCGKKNKKKQAETEQKNDILAFTNSFVFESDSSVVDFFFNLAKTKHNAIKKSKFVQIEHTSSRVILYPYFMYRDFLCDDLIFVYNKVKSLHPTRLVICTNNIDNSALKLCEKLPMKIYILDYRQTYFELMKKYNFFPQKTKLEQAKKQTIKDLLCYALNKKRTKAYFFASVLMLLCSFIVPYKLYYTIMSSLLFVLSFVSYTNPTFNKKLKINLLDG